MKEYEISIWEDVIDPTIKNFSESTDYSLGDKVIHNKNVYRAKGNISHGPWNSNNWSLFIYSLVEQRIATIGSNIMRDNNVLIRALEPKFVVNVNGTHQFTFKMYTSYIDFITGEKIINPYLDYLVNERKIKVKWENEWYDFLIKDITENSKDKSITYICEDLFITELGRNGYNLEFDTDLQNNIGTASELVNKILHNSSWKYDEENSDEIYQKIEEPVFEATVSADFQAILQKPSGDEEGQGISAQAQILIFYSSLTAASKKANTGNPVDIQFWYDSSEYETEQNEMLVLNGNCYSLNGCYIQEIDTKDNDEIVTLQYNIYKNCIRNNQGISYSNLFFSINFSNGISSRYRAKRLVNSQDMEYDELLGRYVYKYDIIFNKYKGYNKGDIVKYNNVYYKCIKDGGIPAPQKGQENTWNSNDWEEISFKSSLTGITTTEYESPQNIINLMVNSSNFTNTYGWSIPREIANWNNKAAYNKNDYVMKGGKKYRCIKENGIPAPQKGQVNIWNDEDWSEEGSWLKWQIDPPFTNEVSNLMHYNPKSYLYINSGSLENTKAGLIYNTSLQTNQNYFNPTEVELKKGIIGGFQKGDKYIFRVKVRKITIPVWSNIRGYAKDAEVRKSVDSIITYKCIKAGGIPTPSQGEVNQWEDSDWKKEINPTISYINSNDNLQLHIYIGDMNQKNQPIKNNQPLIQYDGNNNYVINDTKTVNGNTFPNWTDDENNYIERIITCKKSCSAAQIKNRMVGLFIWASGGMWIEDIQFFKYIEDNNEENPKRILPGDKISSPKIVTYYKYYNIYRDSDNNNRLKEPLTKGTYKTNETYYEGDTISRYGKYYKCKENNISGEWDSNNWENITTDIILSSADDITYIYNQTIDDNNNYIPIMTGYKKITSINMNHSNRFNLLQEVAENFKCWIHFNIQHENDGTIKLINGVPQKNIIIKEEIGDNLGWSFEYGIDMESITRKIISKEITTKTIVLNSNNEFAKNGYCAIQDSKYNFSKENFILDFSYYIRNKLIDVDMLMNDLYSTNGIAYYTKLRGWYKEYDKNAQEISNWEDDLLHQQAELTANQKQYNATKEEIEALEQEINFLTGETSPADWHSGTLSDKVESNVATYRVLQTQNEELYTTIEELTNSVKNLKNKITTRKARQKQLITACQNIHLSFFKKYYRYIQEGIWQDEQYIDADKYYLDALSVAYQSALPKIEYDIKVISLNNLDDFANKKFKVGDICYIQDKEFFGYGTDGITPTKFPITINEITNNFDSPGKDIIKVKTYSSAFDDLFQRITATTQQLQYNEGSYKRSVNAVSANGSINYNSLNSTMKEFGSIWK